ncbi:MAG: hypothetical protein LBO72_09565 [Helicobacteraceae bacterium]|jgi:predicted DNA binding CopG/RHH family protein|nr:hypothetical protein [Helicobacteraceae bacterium]
MTLNRPAHYNKRVGEIRDRVPAWRLRTAIIEAIKVCAAQKGVSSSKFVETLLENAPSIAKEINGERKDEQ